MERWSPGHMFRTYGCRSPVKAVNDLKLIDARQCTWETTGKDPQFALKNKKIFPLPPGHYKMIAIGGTGLWSLTEASIYIDTGLGFSENERLKLEFLPDERPHYFAYCVFEKPVLNIRFDPAGQSRIRFGLQSFEFRRIGEDEWQRRSSVIRARKSNSIDNNQPKVLVNLVRLLPGTERAGGAGRMANALLAYLPEFVAVRAVVTPLHRELLDRYPDVDFVLATADDNEQLNPHLDWCDCYIDPLNALRPTYIPSGIPVLAWVLDLQHMHYPYFFSEAEFEARLREYGYVINRANLLIAISDYERLNFERFYGAHHVDVVHLSGFMAEDCGLTDENISRLRSEARGTTPYLIYPSIPWLHKNHETLVQAIAILRRKGLDVHVVMTNIDSGGRDGGRLASLSTSLGVADLVRLESFMPEQDLLRLFLNSTGLVFPSLYEGFGIPLVDALKLGVPILASRSSAIPEICGDTCAYFSKERNALAVANDLERFWSDAERRTQLIEAGYVRGANFSSRKMASDLFAAIKNLIKEKSESGASGGLPVLLNVRVPKARLLSVFVLYSASLKDNELDYLMTIRDIDQHHRNIFGSAASVTIGVEVSLLTNEKLRGLFASAERLICFSGAKPMGLEAAVQDFCRRYNDGDHYLITAYPKSDSVYRPETLHALLMAFALYPTAHFAIMEPTLKNIVVEPIPSDVEGVLNYDERRKFGYVVFDTVIRRAGPFRDIPNGCAEFLSAFSTRAVKMRFPSAA
jgi:glycosyltransferase involved in cell wall biosynthesis